MLDMSAAFAYNPQKLTRENKMSNKETFQRAILSIGNSQISLAISSLQDLVQSAQKDRKNEEIPNDIEAASLINLGVCYANSGDLTRSITNLLGACRSTNPIIKALAYNNLTNLDEQARNKYAKDSGVNKILYNRITSITEKELGANFKSEQGPLKLFNDTKALFPEKTPSAFKRTFSLNSLKRGKQPEINAFPTLEELQETTTKARQTGHKRSASTTSQITDESGIFFTPENTAPKPSPAAPNPEQWKEIIAARKNAAPTPPPRHKRSLSTTTFTTHESPLDDLSASPVSEVTTKGTTHQRTYSAWSIKSDSSTRTRKIPNLEEIQTAKDTQMETASNSSEGSQLSQQTTASKLWIQADAETLIPSPSETISMGKRWEGTKQPSRWTDRDAAIKNNSHRAGGLFTAQQDGENDQKTR